MATKQHAWFPSKKAALKLGRMLRNVMRQATGYEWQIRTHSNTPGAWHLTLMSGTVSLSVTNDGVYSAMVGKHVDAYGLPANDVGGTAEWMHGHARCADPMAAYKNALAGVKHDFDKYRRLYDDLEARIRKAGLRDSDPPREWKIRVTQVARQLSDPDDRNDLPAGRNRRGAHKDYIFEGETEDEALDVFHRTVPIGFLEDFDIVATEIIKKAKAS